MSDMKSVTAFSTFIVVVYCAALTTQVSDRVEHDTQNVCPVVSNPTLNSGETVQRERRQSLNGNNSSITDICPSIELLRGRDGRDGRDGMPGSPGAQGPHGERGTAGATGRQGPPGPRNGGVVYTRWGKSSCPSVPGTTLVYAGRAGGSHYTHAGASSYLCMPNDPEYTLDYRAGVQGYNYVYGSEYEFPVVGTHDHNVPCAVCAVSTREMVLMIPAKTSCPTSWTREYYGYLMSEHISHRRTNYECVDRAPESLPGSQADTNGALFYPVEANCNGMACPPYNNYKELNCVVCTK